MSVMRARRHDLWFLNSLNLINLVLFEIISSNEFVNWLNKHKTEESFRGTRR